jgi:hypothetical protein
MASTELKVRITVGVDAPMEQAIRFNEFCTRRKLHRSQAFLQGIELLMAKDPDAEPVKEETE